MYAKVVLQQARHARLKGIASGLEGWSRNDRGELMVYDSKFGWTVVVPHQREDIFRALARWLHEEDHASSDQAYRTLRQRFFWCSPQKMMKVIDEVRSECVVCATRKRMQGRTPSTWQSQPKFAILVLCVCVCFLCG